jgi:hypothetical protein
MRSTALAIIFCLSSLHAFSQEASSVLHGKVIAGAPVDNANVGIQETGEHATTNSEGLFSIETSDHGEFTLVVTAMGFEPYAKRITLPYAGELEIRLEKATVEMETIHVEAQREQVPEQTRTQNTVSQEEIKAQPTAGDPFAVVDQEEGVVAPEQLTDQGYTITSLTMSLSNTGRSTYSVYGADSDFNTYYYDYIRIPFNRHAESDAPIIPVEAVGYMEIQKGITPLEFGPGIGGFFRAVPESSFKKDSTLLFSPSSEQLGVIYKKKFSERSGLLLTATKSLTEISTPAIMWGMKALYDGMGMPMFAADPIVLPSYADICLRYFTAFNSQSLTLDLLGYYDWSRGVMDMLGNYDVSSTRFPYYGALGFHWTAPPMPSVLNDASAYASVFMRTGVVDMNMDLVSFLTAFATLYGVDPQEMIAQLDGAVVEAQVHESPAMDVISFEGKDSLLFFVTDSTSLTAGIDGRYSMLGASYEASTDINMQIYGFSMSQKYTVPRFEIHEDIAKLHVFASMDSQLSQLDLHAGAAYTWFPLSAFSAPSVEGELSWNGSGGWSASLRAGWSVGAYDEFAYLERRMNERVLGLPQSSSYSNLPASAAASGKVVFASDKSSSLVFQPYFSWYYGLSGLALYASYLDPYRSGSDSRDLVSQTQMLDPDIGFSTGGGLSWKFTAAGMRWELGYIPSLTMYHRRNVESDPWFFPNNDVRHTFKSTCSFALGNNNQLSASFNLYMDKPFTPEQVADPTNGTLIKESFNSARDLVPRFALGVKWESDSKFFGLPGRTEIDCKNLLAFLNPELVGMKQEMLSVAGASTKDFTNREYRFLRTDLFDILRNMEIKIGGTYSL